MLISNHLNDWIDFNINVFKCSIKFIYTHINVYFCLPSCYAFLLLAIFSPCTPLQITVLQLSTLLKQADSSKRKLTLTRLASAPVPFTVLSLTGNPCNEDYLAVCGLKVRNPASFEEPIKMENDTDNNVVILFTNGDHN